MAELTPTPLLAMAQKIDAIYALLVNMQGRLEYQLTFPEEKAKMAEKAKELLEKMKKEADAEIENELEKRRERGIPRDGDAVTEEDLKTIDSY